MKRLAMQIKKGSKKWPPAHPFFLTGPETLLYYLFGDFLSSSLAAAAAFFMYSV